MKLKLSTKNKGNLAIVGHVGCGHCHSHNNFIQDDSGGLATVLAIFQEATNLSLVIKDIEVKTGIENFIKVQTVSGGVGYASARRGITIHEKNICKSLIGKEGIRTQSIVMEAFGRFYGQGSDEVPVALQTAIANASLDSFVKNYPENFFMEKENIDMTIGYVVGAVIDFGNIPVAVLGTVNATIGGLGPIEDLEGNSTIGSKKNIMKKMNMIDIPTIVIEGKIYSPSFTEYVSEDTFMIRADEQEDNPIVGSAIFIATKELGYESIYRKDAMKRKNNSLRELTKELGEKIIKQGELLKEAEYSQEKVKILANLSKLIQEDGGGISFMSNSLHETIGGVGMMPSSGAVFNMVVPKDYYEKYIFPYFTEKDLLKFINVTKKSVEFVNKTLSESNKHIEENKKDINLDKFVIMKGGKKI